MVSLLSVVISTFVLFDFRSVVFCRDIPMPLVTSGVEHDNIRELVLKRMKDLGLPCRDVRTRYV